MNFNFNFSIYDKKKQIHRSTQYSKNAIMSLPKSIQFLVLGGHTLLPSNPSEQFAQQPLQNGDIETEYHPTPGFTLFLQFYKT